MKHCSRCGHDWEGYVATPKQCPKCKSPYWDRDLMRPRVSAKRKEAAKTSEELMKALPILMQGTKPIPESMVEGLPTEAAVAIPDLRMPWDETPEDEGVVRETVYDRSDPDTNQEVRRGGRPKR